MPIDAIDAILAKMCISWHLKSTLLRAHQRNKSLLLHLLQTPYGLHDDSDLRTLTLREDSTFSIVPTIVDAQCKLKHPLIPYRISPGNSEKLDYTHIVELYKYIAYFTETIAEQSFYVKWAFAER